MFKGVNNTNKKHNHSHSQITHLLTTHSPPPSPTAPPYARPHPHLDYTRKNHNTHTPHPSAHEQAPTTSVCPSPHNTNSLSHPYTKSSQNSSFTIYIELFFVPSYNYKFIFWFLISTIYISWFASNNVNFFIICLIIY